MAQVQSNIRDKLYAVVTGMGYEFVGCEWVSHHLLRIYIDTSRGVSLDDCTSVSRQLSAMLDVEDLISGKYVLEVSSPGIDRPLFELTHYHQQIGKKIKIQLQKPLENRRNWVGVLEKIEDQTIYLMADGKEQSFSFDQISKAHVVADIPYHDHGTRAGN